MIAPHGGRLVRRIAGGAAADALREEAGDLPQVPLAPKEAADAVMIAIGAYSPLEGFMDHATYRSVVEAMHLPDGLPWTLPVTLPVEEDLARRLRAGGRVALRAPRLLAVLTVTDVFRRDLEAEAHLVFGTTEPRHPGVARILGESPWVLGGEIHLVDRPPALFPERTLDPEQTRAQFERAGWRTVTAFQTRNPTHRAHEYLQKCALEITDGLLFHPLVGETKDDDVPALVRMRCYEAMLKSYYPRDRVLLATFPAAMRYGGPREAVFHAVVRKNYGASHIIIGRDHAGVGNFYDPYAAHQIFRSFDPRALEITPLFFEDSFFCRRCNGMATLKTCPHTPEVRVTLSGTRLRAMLQAGEMPPAEVVRPEVAVLLIESYTAGLPASAGVSSQNGETPAVRGDAAAANDGQGRGPAQAPSAAQRPHSG